MAILRRIVLIGLFAACSFAATAAAQEELNDDRKVERYREITQTLTESIYRRLNSIHKKLAEENHQEAIAALVKMEMLPLRKYEEALVFQTFGFAYVQQGKYQLALEYFEKCLAVDSLPGAAQQGMLYSLSGLYAAEGHYIKAIETMRRWFRFEQDPIADAYMVIASSFAELQRFEEALPYVRKAIQIAEEPRENWYLLELAIYFDKERYREAADLLRTVVQFWPGSAKYWNMLVAAHLELNQDKQALDTMMVAYTKGLIEDEQKIVALAQLNMVLDIPYTGGAILEKAIADGNVEADKHNLDILLQAWLSSKEYGRAIRTIDRLGPLAEDGSYFMQKAGIHNELGEWAQVPVAVNAALEMGLKDPTTAYMLAGMAYTEMRQFDKAVVAFRDAGASGNDKQRKNATAWIEFVQGKIAVQSAALN